MVKATTMEQTKIILIPNAIRLVLFLPIKMGSVRNPIDLSPLMSSMSLIISLSKLTMNAKRLYVAITLNAYKLLSTSKSPIMRSEQLTKSATMIFPNTGVDLKIYEYENNNKISKI